MPADSQPRENPDTPPTPVDAHATGNMGWVMPIWLIAFLVVVVFGIISYLFGWWYHRSVEEKKSVGAAKSTLCVAQMLASHSQSV